MDALKATLEAETLGKVDLQNHIQSLKEEMAFKRKVHDEVGGWIRCAQALPICYCSSRWRKANY